MKDIDNLTLNEIKRLIQEQSHQLQKNKNILEQHSNMISKIATLKANINNNKLSDAEFRKFVSTLF